MVAKFYHGTGTMVRVPWYGYHVKNTRLGLGNPNHVQNLLQYQVTVNVQNNYGRPNLVWK